MVFFSPHHPGPWQYFVKRNDNVGLPLMEVKRKYLYEQLQFEDFQQQQMMILTQERSGGGPTSLPSPPPSGNSLLAENGDVITDEGGNPIIIE